MLASPALFLLFLPTFAHSLPTPLPSPDLASLLSEISHQITVALPINAIPSSLAASLTATIPAIKIIANPKVVLNPKKTPSPKLAKRASRQLVVLADPLNESLASLAPQPSATPSLTLLLNRRAPVVDNPKHPSSSSSSPIIKLVSTSSSTPPTAPSNPKAAKTTTSSSPIVKLVSTSTPPTAPSNPKAAKTTSSVAIKLVSTTTSSPTAPSNPKDPSTATSATGGGVFSLGTSVAKVVVTSTTGTGQGSTTHPGEPVSGRVSQSAFRSV